MALADMLRAAGARPVPRFPAARRASDVPRLSPCQPGPLVGLELHELVIDGIPGRATINQCRNGHASVGGAGTPSTFLVDGCAQVLVTNSTLLGATGDEFTFIETPGVEVRSSVVCFTSCAIHGGDGGHFGFGGGPSGEPGIEALQGSQVTVALTSVTGGDGGSGIELCQSSGAPAIWAEDSTIDVRGTTATFLDGGDNCPSGDSFTIAGVNSSVFWSLATLDLPAFGPGILVSMAVNPPEPCLSITDTSSPEDAVPLNVYAPAGKQLSIFASLSSALMTVGKVTNGPLWFDPASVLVQFPLTAAGPDVSLSVPLNLPGDAALAGTVVSFQGFMPLPTPGKYYATNPAVVTLRF
jgi:hypothetical protein